MVIHQGDLFWVRLEADGDLEGSIPHPHVVLQATVLNQSRLTTVVVCSLTTNLKRAAFPGNVLLHVGEGNLPKQSVVEVSKVSSMEKTQLGEYIGRLSEARVNQIFDGIGFLQRTYFTD
jgi:mRNA interferase MazF